MSNKPTTPKDNQNGSDRNIEPTENNGIGILRLYRESVKNLPFLKYSWVFIATIAILALVGFFNLKEANVFNYVWYVIGVTFIVFLLSTFTKSRSLYVRGIVYFMLSCIGILFAAITLGFAYYIFNEKPTFYDRLLNIKRTPDTELSNDKKVPETPHNPKDTSSNPKVDTPKIAVVKKKFIIIGTFKSKNLKKQIAKRKNLEVSNTNPDYKIEITYQENGLQELSNGKYKYNGGHVVIKINNEECEILPEPLILATFHTGDKKEKVISDINNDISMIIEKNETKIQELIIKCLNEN